MGTILLTRASFLNTWSDAWLSRSTSCRLLPPAPVTSTFSDDFFSLAPDSFDPRPGLETGLNSNPNSYPNPNPRCNPRSAFDSTCGPRLDPRLDRSPGPMISMLIAVGLMSPH